MAVVPAAGPLDEVATDGPDRPDLRSGQGASRLGQRRVGVGQLPGNGGHRGPAPMVVPSGPWSMRVNPEMRVRSTMSGCSVLGAKPLLDVGATAPHPCSGGDGETGGGLGES